MLKIRLRRKIDYALGAVLDISSKPVEKDMEDND